MSVIALVFKKELHSHQYFPGVEENENSPDDENDDEVVVTKPGGKVDADEVKC